MRVRSIVLENAEIKPESGRESDFPEGLSIMLSGVCVNMSKAVCSSTMAHHIMSNNGPRFEYSHEFTDLQIGQTMNVLNDKDDQFHIRTNYCRTQKK